MIIDEKYLAEKYLRNLNNSDSKHEQFKRTKHVLFLAYSLPNESTLAELNKNVDKIFSMGWLRQLLRKRASEWLNNERFKTLHDNIFENHLVEWLYLCRCGFGLGEINAIVEMCDKTENLRNKLEKEREVALRELSHYSHAFLLKLLKEHNEDAWNKFVSQFKPLIKYDLKEIANPMIFFTLIDRISIITDILNGRSSEWGLSINLYDYQSPLVPLSHEIVKESLRRCSGLFKGDNDNSWAAIYCILKATYPKFEVEGNQVTSKYTNFERYINMIRSDASLSTLPDCKADNLRKKVVTLDYNDIESWDDKELKDLAKEFKRTLYLRRQSDGDSAKAGEDS